MPVHRYIPNSVLEIKRKMLNEIGVKNVEELFAVIPEKIRFEKRLEQPYPTPEYEVRRHVEALLSKNKTCNELLTFLGGGEKNSDRTTT